MRCFAAEVRWLFPVNRQKKRKPRKQPNTEPLLKLNQNTGLLKSVLRAHQLKSKHLFWSCFNVVGHLFIILPFMLKIFVCFSSRANFLFFLRVVSVLSPCHLLHIFYPPCHLPVHVSFEFDFFFFCSNFFYSISLYVCTFENYVVVVT